jgi:chromosome segregation ATPase
VKAALDVAEQRLNECEQAERALRAERDAARHALAAADDAVRQARAQLEHAQHSQGDKLGAINPSARSVDTALRNELGHSIVGPLGSLLSVRDPKWAAAIENMIGRTVLGAYVVRNHDDERRAAAVLTKVGYKPTIYTQPVFDSVLRLPERLQNINSVLRMLDIESAHTPACVINVLIDSLGIEATLLFDTTDEGKSKLFGRQLQPGEPHKGLALNGYQIAVVSGAAENVMPTELTGARVLGVDGRARLANAQRVLRDAEAALAAPRAAEREVDTRQSAAAAATRAARADVGKLETAKRLADRRIETARNVTGAEENKSRVEDVLKMQADIDGAERELSDKQSALAAAKEALESASAELGPARDVEAQLTAREEACSRLVESARERIESMRDQMQTTAADREQAEDGVRLNEDKLAKVRADAEAEEAKLAAHKVAVCVLVLCACVRACVCVCVCVCAHVITSCACA